MQKARSWQDKNAMYASDQGRLGTKRGFLHLDRSALEANGGGGHAHVLPRIKLREIEPERKKLEIHMLLHWQLRYEPFQQR